MDKTICDCLRDFEGLLKYDMISMASILTIIVYDLKRYETKQTHYEFGLSMSK